MYIPPVTQQPALQFVEKPHQRSDDDSDKEDADDHPSVIREVGKVLHIPAESLGRADQLGGGQQEKTENQP